MLSDSVAGAALPCADIERAKRWYSEKLGLDPSEERPDGVRYLTGKGTGFFLYPSSFAGTNKATACGFEVVDLDSEMDELRSRGVQFEEYDLPGLKTENGVATVGGVRGAWFKDSEGNILALDEVR
jgi:catechol 2,3-dioxygenase-like lactoylglutathione lyase family enzyme